MAVPARISIVTLGVEDVERSSRFYEDLGWKRSSASNPHIAWFITADSVLGLFPYDSLAEDATLPAPVPRPAFTGITLAINVESPDDVTRALDEAVQAGGRIVKQAAATDWGGFSGYFADPDGYAWEVAHNPAFTIGRDGSLELPE
ncbi:MAG TPA: VOC family protein [Actinomycetota bacterium]|nr:VOC family protein [Actinomycetota bacterium]